MKLTAKMKTQLREMQAITLRIGEIDVFEARHNDDISTTHPSLDGERDDLRDKFDDLAMQLGISVYYYHEDSIEYLRED